MERNHSTLLWEPVSCTDFHTQLRNKRLAEEYGILGFEAMYFCAFVPKPTFFRVEEITDQFQSVLMTR
jgi:hypothetical protein